MTVQTEDGYTRVANELIDQFCKYHLSGNEWMILWVVIRKTYGWKKSVDKISLTQFEELSGLSRPSVSEAIGKLVGKKVLVVNKDGLINVYQINKHYSTWVTSREKGTSRVFGSKLVGKKVPKLVGKKVHTKEKKETIQKKVHNSKNSLTKCTEEELQTIANDLQVSLSNVTEYHDEIMGKIEDGIFQQKKYGKTVYFTLRNWLRKAIRENKISKQTKEDDYVARLNKVSRRS